MGRPIFLNNNVGNVILEKGAVYEVKFPPEGRWPELKTILRFEGQFLGSYHFQILDSNHSDMFKKAHATHRDTITYDRDSLRSARFNRTTALDVLYGSTKG